VIQPQIKQRWQLTDGVGILIGEVLNTNPLQYKVIQILYGSPASIVEGHYRNLIVGDIINYVGLLFDQRY
jgi:hypothetical protein